MLNILEIEEKIKLFSLNIKSNSYIDFVKKNSPLNFNRTFWSKDLAYSFEPLGLELVGIKGSKYLKTKPSTYKSLHEYKLINDIIYQIKVFDISGFNHNTLYYFKCNNIMTEINFENGKGIYSISELFYLNDIPIFSLKVDKNGRYWYHEYIYKNNRIKEIHTRQYNNKNISFLGVHYVEYIDNVITDIYHFTNGYRINSYRYK